MFFQKVQFKAIKGEHTASAPTLAELAGKIGVSAERLAATLAAYNCHIAKGEPDPLGKTEQYRRSIHSGPFYATNIGAHLKMAPIPALTMGGLSLGDCVWSGCRVGETLTGLAAGPQAARAS